MVPAEEAVAAGRKAADRTRAKVNTQGISFRICLRPFTRQPVTLAVAVGLWHPAVAFALCELHQAGVGALPVGLERFPGPYPESVDPHERAVERFCLAPHRERIHVRLFNVTVGAVEDGVVERARAPLALGLCP